MAKLGHDTILELLLLTEVLGLLLGRLLRHRAFSRRLQALALLFILFLILGCLVLLFGLADCYV